MPRGAFITRPGLVPLADGRDWSLDGALTFRLPDGQRVTAPLGFKTDLASIPPLGTIGGAVMFAAFVAAHFSAGRPQMICLALAVLALLVCLAGAYLKSFGKYTYAAVLHDWVFQSRGFGFHRCNGLLWIAMRAQRTVLWERLLIWLGVTLCGYGIYLNDQRKAKR